MSQSRREPISSGSRRRSVYGDLEDSICLLALITRRPPDLEGLVGLVKEVHSRNDHSERTLGVTHIQAPEAEAEASQIEIDVGVDGVEELEDLQIIDTDRDEQQYVAELQSKVLDRLAETLARFKSDPKTRKSPDAKHVSSAIMILYREDERVKILCSKNEGLDTEDKAFLRDWKDCMEAIAKTGEVHQRAASAALLSFSQELHRKKARLSCSI
jgi:hypothetical protein